MYKHNLHKKYAHINMYMKNFYIPFIIKSMLNFDFFLHNNNGDSYYYLYSIIKYCNADCGFFKFYIY